MAEKGHKHHDGKEEAECHKHHDGKKSEEKKHEAKKPETKADAETKSIEVRLTALERQQAVMFATLKDIRSTLHQLARSDSKSKELAKDGPKHKHQEKKMKDKDED